MKMIKVEKKNTDPQHKVGQFATLDHVEYLIKEPTLIFVDDVLMAGYFTPAWDFSPLREMCLRIKYNQPLVQGQKTTSRQFGGAANLTDKDAVAKGTLDGFASLISSIYSEAFPASFKAHWEAIYGEAEKPEEFCLSDSPFTNGIINHTNALPYHQDVGNFDSALTCVHVLQEGICGGTLVFPQIEVGIEVEDCSCVLFDGFQLVHGVAPIRKLSEDGYRFSVVYYTLKSLLLS